MSQQLEQTLANMRFVRQTRARIGREGAKLRAMDLGSRKIKITLPEPFTLPTGVTKRKIQRKGTITQKKKTLGTVVILAYGNVWFKPGGISEKDRADLARFGVTITSYVSHDTSK